MKVFNHTTPRIFLASWVSLNPPANASQTNLSKLYNLLSKPNRDILQPLRRWIDNIKVSDRVYAHQLCKMIPAQCPFERDVKLLGKTLFHIPPMCKLNPLYDEVVFLRFRALCYLADECGEDISQYC